MTVRLDGASYLRLAAKIAGAYPFTVVCWAGIRSTGANMAFWGQSEASPGSRYAYQRASATGNVTAGTGWSGGTGGSATNKTPTTINATLRVAMAVFKTSGSPYCENYYGSNSPSQDTNAIVDQITNHNEFVVGAYDIGGFGAYLNGDIAELHIYNTALSASDWTTLNAMTGTIDGPTQGPESIAGWVDGFALTSNSDLTSIGGTRTLTLTGSFSGSPAQAHPFTRSAAPTLTGNVTLDAVSPAGTLADAGPTSLSGDVTLDAVAPSGTLGLQPGTVTAAALKNWSGSLQTSVTIPVVTVLSLTTGAQVLALTDQVTDATTADLEITSTSLVAGTTYMVAGWNADGSNRFAVPLTAT